MECGQTFPMPLYSRLCQKSPQQRVDATVISLGVLVYAAAKEVRRSRVRAV